MAHDQPTYASVPGIRVFGMMCTKPDDGVVNHGIQRPAPPKRNQYFQTQSSYYQRFKKHTLSKLTAQQKTNGEPSAPSSSSSSLNSNINNNIQLPTQQSAELLSSDFTTRGINIVSGQPAENREDDEKESNESSEEISSSTYDSLSSSYGTTTDTIDAFPTETNANSVSRSKRTIQMNNEISAESDELDAMDGNGSTFSESSRRNKNNNDDDWPSIPWDEISQQIKDIQWD